MSLFSLSVSSAHVSVFLVTRYSIYSAFHSILLFKRSFILSLCLIYFLFFFFIPNYSIRSYSFVRTNKWINKCIEFIIIWIKCRGIVKRFVIVIKWSLSAVQLKVKMKERNNRKRKNPKKTWKKKNKKMNEKSSSNLIHFFSLLFARWIHFL